MEVLTRQIENLRHEKQSVEEKLEVKTRQQVKSMAQNSRLTAKNEELRSQLRFQERVSELSDSFLLRYEPFLYSPDHLPLRHQSNSGTRMYLHMPCTTRQSLDLILWSRSKNKTRYSTSRRSSRSANKQCSNVRPSPTN